MRLFVNINNKELTLVFRQPGDPHLLGYPLDLARARTRRVHLGHRWGERPVDPLVALDDVPRKKLLVLSLGTRRLRSPHARLGPSVPVPVAAVAGRLAHLLGLRGHHSVGDVLGDSADQLLEVDAAVLEPRHLRLRGDALCYAFHCGPRPFVEPDFVVISDSRTGSLLFHLVALIALPRLRQHSRRDLHAGCGSSAAAPRARWPRAGAGIAIPAGRCRAPTRSRGPAHVLFWAAGRLCPT